MHGTHSRKRPRLAALPTDPYESARVAGLRYVTDEQPGIVRKRSGRGFCYLDPEGKPVTDKDTLKRIRSLVIPPAWTNVWICASKNGHLQAVGRDARGRKQYRYHPLYRAVRDATKYSRMAAFAAAIPAIRERVHHDLELPGMPREKILATVVRLLERTAIRVGNEEYAKCNNSYGLTTMQDKHVDISGYKLRFHFRGKSGLVHDIELTDRKLARILRDCQEIPGHELFHYIDESGEICKINSEDVNAYLREITGEDFTAKDFRTWVGSAVTVLELEQVGPANSETEAKKNIVTAVKNAAAKLGNKPSTCRNYYVHPAVLESYMDGRLFEEMKKVPESSTAYALRREESCLLELVAAHAASSVLKAQAA
jgi:DNA topoisomerase-1